MSIGLKNKLHNIRCPCWLAERSKLSLWHSILILTFFRIELVFRSLPGFKSLTKLIRYQVSYPGFIGLSFLHLKITTELPTLWLKRVKFLFLNNLYQLTDTKLNSTFHNYCFLYYHKKCCIFIVGCRGGIQLGVYYRVGTKVKTHKSFLFTEVSLKVEIKLRLFDYIILILHKSS